MKLWGPKTQTDEGEDLRLEASLRSLETPRAAGPDSTYFQNLIVRTNARIDRAASGRALTISWAARVAIPGAVAIISFLVALSYYVPERREASAPFAEVVRNIPVQAMDSLVLAALAPGDSARVEYVAEGVFAAGDAEISDYIIERGSTDLLAEYVSTQDLGQVLALLGSTER